MLDGAHRKRGRAGRRRLIRQLMLEGPPELPACRHGNGGLPAVFSITGRHDGHLLRMAGEGQLRRPGCGAMAKRGDPKRAKSPEAA